MSNESIAAGLYLQVLGRPADSTGLANATAALDAGETAGQLALALASSPEGLAHQAAAAYSNILGRPIDGSALANATAALGNGETLAQLQAALAASPEAAGDIGSIYQNELGRAPDMAGLQNAEQSLANGGSLPGLRSLVSTSAEAQSALTNLYQTELGRAPDATGLASATQYLANGGSLTALQSAVAGSPEVASDVNRGYQAALGHDANVVEQAAARSELASGVPYIELQSELEQLSDPTVPYTAGNAAISPQTIAAGSSTSLVYSLGYNDALIASQPAKVFFGVRSGLLPATVFGFDPNSDVIEVQKQQAASFSALNISDDSYPASGPISLLTVPNGGRTEIFGVAPASLHASNFQFV